MPTVLASTPYGSLRLQLKSILFWGIVEGKEEEGKLFLENSFASYEISSISYIVSYVVYQ